MRIDAVLAAVPNTQLSEITDWIARGWIVPAGTPPDWVFSEIDVARVRLVRELYIEIGIEVDTLPVVLSLLDQVYDLRHTLHSVLAALDDQPQSVRDAVLARVRRDR